MRIVSINDPESVSLAAHVLKEGGVIVFPTDTAYGLGADATNPAAVAKIFDAKGRDEGKPLPIFVHDIERAREIGTFTPAAEKLAAAFWPGALTLIVEAKNATLSHILRNDTAIGIRIPDSTWCRDLAKALGSPVTSTSANASGMPAVYSINAVRDSLGATADLVDLWVDGGELAGREVSTTVRSVGAETTIMRHGAIPEATIQGALQE